MFDAFSYPTSFKEPFAMSSSFPFDMRERVAFFIDGANFYQTARALNVDIDYWPRIRSSRRCAH